MTVTNTTVLEAVLRRDRMVLLVALVAVTAIAWIWILLGAGTGMNAVAMTVGAGMSGMAGMMMAPAAWTAGYAGLMFVTVDGDSITFFIEPLNLDAGSAGFHRDRFYSNTRTGRFRSSLVSAGAARNCGYQCAH